MSSNSTTATVRSPHVHQFSPAVGIVHGALAGCGAAVVSNPFEVIKTRLQLQGELQKQGLATVHYKGLFQGLWTIFKNEGVAGVQKGLFAAFPYQILLNGSRLGMYLPIKNQIQQQIGVAKGTRRDPSNDGVDQGDRLHRGLTWLEHSSFAALASGYVCGFVSSVIANPFFLVKTRMQSQSDVLQVGKQHHYKNTLDGLRQLYAKEGGLRGWFQGSYFAALRTGAGSAVQLASYDGWKLFLMSELQLQAQDHRLHFLCAILSSFIVMVAMNPPDVVMTRVYNSGAANSKYNRGFVSAFLTIARTEGLGGLYKGAPAMWARVAPHTICTFMLLEQLRNVSAYLGLGAE